MLPARAGLEEGGEGGCAPAGWPRVPRSHRGAVPAGVRAAGAGPGTEGPGAAMTTGDCCHLPGSLCDCPGSAALSKSVEDSDIGRPQYVTQVTAKDGRLLSTVIKALGAQR